ncbi:hypothetical protein Pmar_PMAR025960 [Perkinsus marinus ATCC 50983]|uniref:DNA-directed RNA polymerase III subunit n=1 Tax=Perkinsus marinus (strain ATCC 50983 / TXsc) TaxID=423536 RepID=C5L1H8_PERM5|nr:hypothetical protein Pmar_PMAR025960 [Perkinsus marinus ATCC 50983]EER09405.1 hypothetical protein Pmar_PMAR025960 [Perkinsus marinus ATCC 50983]|eukprot:XP_002777589.1 hypothetical protein Pmar_PMAR025960 [Perkinsus marinus ATCC 50983]
MPFGGKGKGKGRGGGPRFGGERRGPLAAPPPPYPSTYEVSEFQGLTPEDEMLVSYQRDLVNYWIQISTSERSVCFTSSGAVQASKRRKLSQPGWRETGKESGESLWKQLVAEVGSADYFPLELQTDTLATFRSKEANERRKNRKSLLKRLEQAGGDGDDDGGESDNDDNEAMEEYAEVTDNESFGGDDYEITADYFPLELQTDTLATFRSKEANERRKNRKSLLKRLEQAGGDGDDDGGESDNDDNEAMEEYAEVTDNESFGGDDYEITGEFEDEGARGGDEDDDDGGAADYF